MHRAKFGMEEDLSLDSCFDFFRRKESTVDPTWVKEQIYRTSCVPEKCPPTPSLRDILRRRPDSEPAKSRPSFRFD